MNTDDLKAAIELDQKGWPTKNWLEQAYLEKGFSTLAIADSIRRREHDFIPIFREILNNTSKQLAQAQTYCIGGTPENQGNTEATNPKGAESVTSIRTTER